jgi:secreted PhoX family phosphatase
MTSRRDFLHRLSLATAAAMAPSGLEALCARVASGRSIETQGFGRLVPDPSGLLDLPEGFRYRSFSSARLGDLADMQFSQTLTNGEHVPALHDGMAAFSGAHGLMVLIRNHEMDPGQVPAVAPGRSPRWDRLGTGGTTTLWVNEQGEMVRAFASLAGTFRNCAGGATPWGSWLSAEECVYTAGPPDPHIHHQRPDVTESHGYMFEVDSRAEDLVPARPIRGMGRFYHEAVAVDPATGYVYLTEDRADGLFYRFKPHVITSRRKQPRALMVGDLHEGGTLEALRLRDHPRALTQNHEDGPPRFTPGKWMRIDWVAIPDPEPKVDMERDPTDREPDPLKRLGRTASTSTRAQGFALGAAQFSRCEGITRMGHLFYICATNGGHAGAGQVWKLDPGGNRIALVIEPNDRDQLDGPDNLTVAPNGDLMVCEDGTGENFVVGVTPRGTCYHFARNAYNRSEFAGACFSADGRTLFVNMQDPGVTYAIQGPWQGRKA